MASIWSFTVEMKKQEALIRALHFGNPGQNGIVRLKSAPAPPSWHQLHYSIRHHPAQLFATWTRSIRKPIFVALVVLTVTFGIIKVLIHSSK
jgi:hypothetical protein